MFRNNRNKQKTNRNSSKFVNISTFLIPHTISSVCFDTGLKHRNKLKTIFWFGEKNKPKKPKQIEFRFKPRKKINCFEDLLIENVFLRFFWFVSVCFNKVLFVSVVSIPVRNTETNRNKPKQMYFCFCETNRKTTETD